MSSCVLLPIPICRVHSEIHSFRHCCLGFQQLHYGRIFANKQGQSDFSLEMKVVRALFMSRNTKSVNWGFAKRSIAGVLVRLREVCDTCAGARLQTLRDHDRTLIERIIGEVQDFSRPNEGRVWEHAMWTRSRVRSWSRRVSELLVTAQSSFSDWVFSLTLHARIRALHLVYVFHLSAQVLPRPSKVVTRPRRPEVQVVLDE